MLESILLYIKQGLNAHLRAFSPIIIIEDHIYRLLFTHSPKEILADPRCDLALALEIFYLSDGYAYLEDLERTTDLKEWNSFITALYDDISNNKFPKTGKSFKIPLSKVQKYKLQKKGISKIFLIDL